MDQYRNDGSSTVSSVVFYSLAGVIGCWLAWDAFVAQLVLYSPWADYWEHSATLAEWLRNFNAPTNPHVADPALSPRYMPAFWLLVFIGSRLGLDAIELMAVSSVLNFVVVIIGLRLFLQSYFRSPWAPALGLIVIFMFWGVSYNWSNLYQLRSFFYVAGYPSTLVFGLSLIAWSLTLDIMRRDIPAGGGFLFLSLLAALLFLCHPLTGVFGIVGCGLLALTEGTPRFGTRIVVVLALLGGMAAAELWPYFSVWKLVLGQYAVGDEQWFAAAATDMSAFERLKSREWLHIFYDPRLVVINLGLALLGLPLLMYYLIRRDYLFIVAGAAAMLLPYAAHLLIEIPLAHRFLLYAVTFMHLAIVAAWLQIITYWQTLPRSPIASVLLVSSVLVAGVAIIGNVGLLALEFSGKTLFSRTLTVIDKRANLPDGMNTVQLYEKLLEPVADDAIVLTTAQLGWPLPTVKAKVVALYHENPMVLDQGERYRKMRAFFYVPMTEARRFGIVQKYAATHVLISTADEGVNADVRSWLASYARLVAHVGDYRMYRLLPAVQDTWRADEAIAPQAQPVEEPMEANGGLTEQEAGVAERNFGAPIADPLLNPERHGGDAIDKLPPDQSAE